MSTKRCPFSALLLLQSSVSLQILFLACLCHPAAVEEAGLNALLCRRRDTGSWKPRSTQDLQRQAEPPHPEGDVTCCQGP